MTEETQWRDAHKTGSREGNYKPYNNNTNNNNTNYNNTICQPYELDKFLISCFISHICLARSHFHSFTKETQINWISNIQLVTAVKATQEK